MLLRVFAPGHMLRLELSQHRHDCLAKPYARGRSMLTSSVALQAAHEQRPGSAPELNQFTTLFDDDDDSWAGLMMAQVGLQSEDFLLPEGFTLPSDGLGLLAAPAQEPAKPQSASVYNIQANCSTEVRPITADCTSVWQLQPSTTKHPGIHKCFPGHARCTQLRSRPCEDTTGPVDWSCWHGWCRCGTRGMSMPSLPACAADQTLSACRHLRTGRWTSRAC